VTLILVRELRHSPEKSLAGAYRPGASARVAPFDAIGAWLRWNHGEAHHGGSARAACYRNNRDSSRRSEVLEYKWGGFDMRWELEDLSGGTRLTLWTNIGRRFIANGCSRVAHLFRCSGSSFLAELPSAAWLAPRR